MEDRLHVVEGAELGKADFLQALAHHGDVRAKVFGLVRVAADGEDTAAEVVVEAQDLNAGGEIGQAVSDGRGVELDALVAANRLFKNFRHDVANVHVGPGSERVVALDVVEVSDSRPMVEVLDNAQHLLVVLHVVLLLRPALLERSIPKLLVTNLVDGQDDEVPCIGVLVEQRLVLVERVRLHAEFHTRFHRELRCKSLARPLDGGEVALVVDVDGGLALNDLGAGGVAAVFVPVGADAVVHVVGDADLVDAAFNGERADVFEREDGVVGEIGVHMVIGKHAGSNQEREFPSSMAKANRIGRGRAACKDARRKSRSLRRSVRAMPCRAWIDEGGVAIPHV